jgi:hypothetical protein
MGAVLMRTATMEIDGGVHRGARAAAKLHGFTRQRSSGHLGSSTGCGGLTEEHTSSGGSNRTCWARRRLDEASGDGLGCGIEHGGSVVEL